MKASSIAAVFISLAAIGAAAGWYFYDMGRVRIEACRIEGSVTRIVASVAGRVAKVEVRQGSEVAQGAVLVRLDQAPFRAAVDHERNALAAIAAPPAFGSERLTAQEDSARRAVDTAREKEHAARGRVVELSTAHARAMVELRGLETAPSASSASLQRARQQERDAAAALRKAKLAADQASTARAGAEAELVGLRNLSRVIAQGTPAPSGGKVEEIAAIRNRLEMAERELAATVITTPVAGMVGTTAVGVGSAVKVGSPIMDIVPSLPEQMWVSGYVPRKYASEVHAGMPCEISVPSVPVSLAGYVVSVERSGVVERAGNGSRTVAGLPETRGRVEDSGPVTELQGSAGTLVFSDVNGTAPPKSGADGARLGSRVHIALRTKDAPAAISSIRVGMEASVVVLLNESVVETLQNIWKK